MPSGAKKRKAAKKKKEKETEINTNHPSTTNPQGTVFHCALLNFMHAKL